MKKQEDTPSFLLSALLFVLDISVEVIYTVIVGAQRVIFNYFGAFTVVIVQMVAFYYFYLPPGTMF